MENFNIKINIKQGISRKVREKNLGKIGVFLMATIFLLVEWLPFLDTNITPIIITEVEAVDSITLDTTSNGWVERASQLTVAHTCTGTDTDGILIVTIQVTDSAIGDRTISSVTHNGEALTHLAGADSDAYSEERTEIWYRLNPTAGGTPNIVVTAGGACTDLSLGAISLTDVGDSPAFVTQTSSGENTPPTLDITTIGTDSWVIDSVASEEPGGKLVPTHTNIHNTDVGADEHASQYVNAGGAGSQTMDYTDPDSDTHWAMSAVSVQRSDVPTVALDNPTAGETVSDATPDLLFTGTDTDGDEIEYNIQVDTATTFDSQVGTIIDDNWKEEDNNADGVLYSTSVVARGQSFTGSGGTLALAKLHLKKLESPTGNAVCKIFAHTGTFGTSSVPTGAALATSNTLDVATLTTSYVLKTFTFTGAEKITLTNGTKYVVVMEYSGGNASNLIAWGKGIVGHDGNASEYESSWASDSADHSFGIYIDNNTPLLDKDSSVPDATFSGTGDPHPWPSGNQITYTVQAGDALSETTHYWRVRGKDPLGSNVWGAWSTGAGSGYESFVVSSTGPAISISITTDGSAPFGTLGLNITRDTTSEDLDDVQTVSVDTGPADLEIKSTNYTGAGTLTLSSAPGANLVHFEYSANGSSWNTFEVPNNYYSLATNVAESGTQGVYFRLTTPTSVGSYGTHGADITILASVP